MVIKNSKQMDRISAASCGELPEKFFSEVYKLRATTRCRGAQQPTKTNTAKQSKKLPVYKDGSSEDTKIS